jgi:hypothetical protein
LDGGNASVPCIWGASRFLVFLLTKLNILGFSAGLRYNYVTPKAK